MRFGNWEKPIVVSEVRFADKTEKPNARLTPVSSQKRSDEITKHIANFKGGVQLIPCGVSACDKEGRSLKGVSKLAREAHLISGKRGSQKIRDVYTKRAQ